MARRDAPDVQFISAFLPARPDQPLRLNFRRPDDREGAPAMTVLVDPWRQARLATVDPQNLPAGDAFLAWQRGLHTGAGLGGIYRFLVFLSGLIIPLFAVTGISMWLLQRRMRARTPVRPPLMETAE